MKIRKKIPIYDCTLTIVIDEDIDSCFKAVGMRSDEGELKYLAVALDKLGSVDKGILLPKTTLSKHGIIAHECKHVVNFIFLDKGIKLDAENDEAECYLLDWIVTEVYKAIDKYYLKADSASDALAGIK